MAEIVMSSFMFEEEDPSLPLLIYATKLEWDGSFGSPIENRNLLPSCQIDVSGWD